VVELLLEYTIVGLFVAFCLFLLLVAFVWFFIVWPIRIFYFGVTHRPDVTRHYSPALRAAIRERDQRRLDRERRGVRGKGDVTR
jgi:dolichol kinase